MFPVPSASTLPLGESLPVLSSGEKEEREPQERRLLGGMGNLVSEVCQEKKSSYCAYTGVVTHFVHFRGE